MLPNSLFLPNLVYDNAVSIRCSFEPFILRLIKSCSHDVFPGNYVWVIVTALKQRFGEILLLLLLFCPLFAAFSKC